jgi:tripartite ATP-independent transporter DctM subunit
VRGGLGLVAVFAAVLLAAMSGSASADAAALGTMLLPMMRRAGYDLPRSAGLIAAGSVIAPCMPPSSALIIFGILANVSINKLFMGTLVPALMMAASLIVAWTWVMRRDRIEALPRASVREMVTACRKAVWALIMPFGIVGGMKSGLFTPTEAGVAACAYSLVVGLFIYRELPLKQLYPLLVSAAKTTSLIVFMIAASLISASLITTSDVPHQVSELLTPFMDSPRMLMFVIMVLVMLIGTALEFAPTLMILTPVLMPVVKAAGIDPVYFGILFIMNNAIGLITPPMGVVLNVLSGISKVPMMTVFRGSWPFHVAETGVLFLLVLFPQLVLVPLKWLT